MTAPARWRVCVDRGGTFTDVVARGPAGELRVGKVPSTDAAPLDAIRRALGVADGAPIPPIDLRLGTTLATNALLERRGARTALVITEGFGDLLWLGDQTRRDLFALDIAQLAPVVERVVELGARLSATGEVVAWPADATVDAVAVALAAAGIESVALAVLHATAAPERERALAAALARGGLRVVASTAVVDEQGLLARTDTAVADAYLTPILARYLDELAAALPGSRIAVMMSSGGLTPAPQLRGRDAVVSGPAGGAAALATLVRRHGLPAAIGLDMGGTSTDVTWVDGDHADGDGLYAGVERVHAAEVAGVRLLAPMLAIHTVAAGGGSLCAWDGLRLAVGPASAGADPGPVCYGRAAATTPTVCDADLVLGRLADDCFPFPLDHARAAAALADLDRARTGGSGDAARAAAACVAVADAAMADAIRRVSVARGRDPRAATLVAFGGAAGAHACAVARELQIPRIVVPAHAGVWSAWGLGAAVAT